MKLAFSTIGCPDWKWSEIYSAAKDLKFDGIEVRGVANEMYVPKAKAFDSAHIEKNIQMLHDGGIEIPMLTSGITLVQDEEEALSQLKDYFQLAKELNSKYVRVMITSKPQPERVDMWCAVALYEKMCELGETYNVTPLIETNGELADTKEMSTFIKKIKSDNKGILWDIHHPYRFFNETPEETYKNIGKYIKYVHVKDSIIKDGTLTYRMMGYGDVPVFDALEVLNKNKYEGFISLEWVKKWNPDLEEAGIVFAHFISYMLMLFENL